MSLPFRPTAVPEQPISPYKVRQLDDHGDVLSETQVAAHSCSAALQELNNVVDDAQRIEVYNEEGEKAGEVNVDYWRIKRRRR